LQSLPETVEDYYARLNFDGNRTCLFGNRDKINYVYEKCRKYFNNANDACEVGVGDGYLLRRLYNSGLKVVGIDISKFLVNRLQSQLEEENLDIKLIRGDISTINLESDKFDLVFCLDVLEHIFYIKDAIEKIKTILKIGGLLIVTLPWKENLDNNMVICPQCHHKFHRVGHYHSFDSIDELNQLLGLEFEIIQCNEVQPVKKPSDIIKNLFWLIGGFRYKRSRTVYLIAKLKR